MQILIGKHEFASVGLWRLCNWLADKTQSMILDTRAMCSLVGASRITTSTSPVCE